MWLSWLCIFILVERLDYIQFTLCANKQWLQTQNVTTCDPLFQNLWYNLYKCTLECQIINKALLVMFPFLLELLLVFMWRSHIPKFKTVFPSEFLVSSDYSPDSNLAFYNVLARQLHPSEGHKHGVSIWSSVNLGKTLLPITPEWKTAEILFLAKLFIYLSSIISHIPDFIYWMLTMFRFDHMIGENQQLVY